MSPVIKGLNKAISLHSRTSRPLTRRMGNEILFWELEEGLVGEGKSFGLCGHHMKTRHNNGFTFTQ